MLVTLTCPTCSAILKMSSSASADQTFQCPRCGATFDAAGASAAQAHRPVPSQPMPASEADVVRPSPSADSPGARHDEDDFDERRPPLKKRSRALTAFLVVLGVAWLGVGACGGLYYLALRAANKASREMQTALAEAEQEMAAGNDVEQAEPADEELTAIRALVDRFAFIERTGASYHVELKPNATDADVARLKVVPNMTSLSMGTGDKLTDDALVHLKDFKDLEHLDLSNTPLNDAGLAQLKKLTKLEILVLSGTKITDAGLVHLKDMKELSVLKLDNNPNITDAGLIHLKALPSLNVVDLKETKITPRGLDDLRAALPGAIIHAEAK
jgi:hypothetical protein